MPDEHGKKTADEEELPKTSLHAYKDGREEDVEGDPTGQDVQEKPLGERGDPDKH